MADIIIHKNSLKSLGNAIRNVNGLSTLYTPQQMADQINSWTTSHPRIYLYNYAETADPFCGVQTGGWSLKGQRGYNNAKTYPGASAGGVMGYGRILVGQVTDTTLTNNITNNVLSLRPSCATNNPILSMATFRALPVKAWLDAGYDTFKIKWAKENDPSATLTSYAPGIKPNIIQTSFLFSTQVSAPNSTNIVTALGTYGGAAESDYVLETGYDKDNLNISSFNLSNMAANGLAVQDNLYFSITARQKYLQAEKPNGASYANGWSFLYILTMYVCKGDEDVNE